MGNNEQTFYIHFLAINNWNDAPEAKNADEAAVLRLIVQEFTKQRVNKKPEECNEFELPADSKLKEELKTLRFKHAFVYMMILQEHRKFLEGDRRGIGCT